MNKLVIILVSIFLFGCVSQEDYNNVKQENDILKEELDDLKYGSEKLLRQGTDYFNKNEFDSAEAKLSLLISKHGDSKEAIDGKKLLDKIASSRIELEDYNAWKLAEQSKDISTVESYITSHPSGKYISQAYQRINALKIENEQSAYDNAVSSNSSQIWKKFLSDYPNRQDVQEIRDKIIQAEIDEISRQSNVSSLPSSYRTGGGYSSTSVVKISNNTQYTLIVRYSGPQVASISIPSYGTRSISLLSGYYKIAATAGSVSCAGNENLSGDYSSTYYITTTRY